MKKYFSVVVFTLLITSHLAVATENITETKYKNSEELIHNYPNIGEFSSRKENKNIICPFHRMLERAGVYDTKRPTNNSKIIVSILKIAKKAREFGCEYFSCGSVATLVSSGQLTNGKDLFSGKARFGAVNLTRLHKAKGTAHQCGLTFVKNGTKVSEEVRSNTLRKLEEISESNIPAGNLSKENLMKVKLDICKSQDVKISGPGKLEVELIYAYLGGRDRGFIEYDDVVRFLHAKMPLTKSVSGLSL